mmetsp:Transcript_14428/g.19763  ORF Transcript_14428/g.19763 Transcript_14428/m.19763 type:complete len:152 (+) Transcript_14428:151-606(+)
MWTAPRTTTTADSSRILSGEGHPNPNPLTISIPSSPGPEGSFFSFSSPIAPPSTDLGLFGGWGGLFSGGLGLGLAGSSSPEADKGRVEGVGYTDMRRLAADSESIPRTPTNDQESFADRSLAWIHDILGLFSLGGHEEIPPTAVRSPSSFS